MVEINLKDINLNDLILFIGGFVYRGGTSEDIELALLLKLQELAEEEIEQRLTGIPKGTLLH